MKRMGIGRSGHRKIGTSKDREIGKARSVARDCAESVGLQVANGSDDDNFLSKREAWRAKSQLHALIPCKSARRRCDDESFKSGKSWQIKRTVPKKVFQCLCRFSSIDGSQR